MFLSEAFLRILQEPVYPMNSLSRIELRTVWILEASLARLKIFLLVRERNYGDPKEANIYRPVKINSI